MDAHMDDEMSPHLKDYPEDEPWSPPDHFIPTVVSRLEWGGLPAQTRLPIDLPINYVFYSAETEFKPCKTREECCAEVRKIQKHYMDKGYADIPYSFIVGNDGNVYEGRGWWFAPGPEGFEKNPNLKQNNKIDIAVICGHDEIIPEKMDMVREAFRMADKFLEFGVRSKMISENHQFLFSDDVTAEEPEKVK